MPYTQLAFLSKESQMGVSLVVQQLRRCLAMQGIQVGSLVGKLRSHNLCGGLYACSLQIESPWATAAEPTCHNRDLMQPDKERFFKKIKSHIWLNLFYQELLLYFSQRKTSVDGERVNSLF